MESVVKKVFKSVLVIIKTLLQLGFITAPKICLVILPRYPSIPVEKDIEILVDRRGRSSEGI
jgi:hypothetical protein